MEMEIVNYSTFHIHTLVKETECQVQRYSSSFYGQPETSNRSLSLELLSRINKSNDIPWCVVEDFNEILS